MKPYDILKDKNGFVKFLLHTNIHNLQRKKKIFNNFFIGLDFIHYNAIYAVLFKII